MMNLFNSVKLSKLKRNLFDLSHDVKLTCDMGELVPILMLDCIPGDTHEISCEALVRFAPMIAPVMHRYDVTMHYFFVPNRLLWPNWENYITNTKDPQTGLLPVHPFYTFASEGAGSIQPGDLADYLGVPTNVEPTAFVNDIKVNALPFAAYSLVWFEYYRDQNMIPVPNNWHNGFVPLNDGQNFGDPMSPFNKLRLQRRAWEHDYFTSALPWAQKGDPVTIPGDIVLKDNLNDMVNFQKAVDVHHNDGSGSIKADAGSQGRLTDDGGPTWIDPNGSLESGGTINELRRAFKLQEWLEKAARGGSRYAEWLRVMFGVVSPDSRLQRPEYIFGTKAPVVISEVLNTTGTLDLPQGNMAGHGVSVTGGNYGKYYCQEHGFIVGIMSIIPKNSYMNSIEKMWYKTQHPTDYFFSSFANIGEQSILANEITPYYEDSQLNSTVFGYIPRYAEYRFKQNRICGDFRTNLKYWHQARIFDTNQGLNEAFIDCYPDKRIFAVEDPQVDSLYCQVYNKIKSKRPMPKYGTPTF